MTRDGEAIQCGSERFVLSERTHIMGILNTTPDSFSDGGKYHGESAVAHGLRLKEQGADVIDIGGESTRPGAAPVSIAEEQDRVLPVIADLVKEGVDTISIDTRNADTAKEALHAGASWINDVMGFRDPQMVHVAPQADAYILMHSRDTPEKMQEGPIEYADVVDEVRSFFEERVAYAAKNGLHPQKIILDPGIGFGKTLAHNLALTNSIDRMQVAGTAGFLYGPSRKRFLGELTGIEQAEDRDIATMGALAVAVANGAHVVRVHDVMNTRHFLQVLDSCRRCGI